MSRATRPVRISLTLLALSRAAGVPVVAQEQPLPLDRPTVFTLQAVSSIVVSLDAYRTDHGAYPGSEGAFVDAQFLVAQLSPAYIRELPILDGWGNPFRYASDGTDVAVLSAGPDGNPDRAYPGLDAFEPIEGAGDDLVWSEGHLVICPESIGRLERLGGQKRTMADLRSIGTAIEAHRIDRGSYPATDGYVAVATIRARVEPFYIRSLPLADAWGNTLLYRSDGQSYRIVSNGWDGKADRPYDEVVAGTTTQMFASDIVFGDGEFLQRPEGEQH